MIMAIPDVTAENRKMMGMRGRLDGPEHEPDVAVEDAGRGDAE
jgi:hypothetical protein